MNAMAKKKQSNKADRHKSGYMLRLPEHFREMLQDLTQDTRRTMTEEVKIALERYLKGEGKWKDPPSKGSR